MTTIKELAEILPVSKTTIYNMINKHNIQTFKIDGVKCLDAAGVTLVKAYFETEKQSTIADIVEDMKENAEKTELLEEYKNIVKLLQSELAEKNSTISGLIQVLTVDRVLETKRIVVENDKKEVSETPERQGFFTRLIKKITEK